MVSQNFEKRKLLNKDKHGGFVVQQRHVLTAMLFSGYSLAFMVRVNFSVAIVAMVNQTYVKEHNEDRSLNDSCPNLEPSNSSTAFEHKGEFKWTQEMQGIISGSFFYGYALSQLIGGILADRFGGKHIFGFGVFLSSIMCILIPPMSKVHVGLLIANRILAGFFQGFSFPAIGSLVSAWAPMHERGFMYMVPNFGMYVGIVIAFPVTGWLCEEGFAGGWPSAFYIFGILGCLWLLPWLYLTSSSPDSHPRITEKEKAYIEESLANETEKQVPVPWKSILKSVPVYAVVISYFMAAFCRMSLLAFIPTYLNEILKFKIVSNGLLSVVPYIASALGVFIAGIVSEKLCAKLNSVSATRKICNSLGCIISVIFLFFVPFVGCNRIGTIALFTSSAFLMSFGCVGFMISPLDIAPKFTGSVMGLANTFGTIGLITGPYATGALTNRAQNLHTWATAFYVMASLTALGGLIFLVFGSGKLQSWAVTSHLEECYVNSEEKKDKTSGKGIL